MPSHLSGNASRRQDGDRPRIHFSTTGLLADNIPAGRLDAQAPRRANDWLAPRQISSSHHISPCLPPNEVSRTRTGFHESTVRRGSQSCREALPNAAQVVPSLAVPSPAFSLGWGERTRRANLPLQNKREAKTCSLPPPGVGGVLLENLLRSSVNQDLSFFKGRGFQPRRLVTKEPTPHG